MPTKRAADTASNPAKRIVHSANELRRAYEYLGRIEILEGALAGSPFVDVTCLGNLAQQQLGVGHPRNAADLLRSAEHLCFAALAPAHVTDSLVNPELKHAITVEFEATMRRAEEQWHEDERSNRHVIEDLFARALDQARQAFTRGAFRSALELARAADALSCIREGLPATLPNRGLTGRLAS